MPQRKPRFRTDYGSLGRLVIAWNDLEFWMRGLIGALAPDLVTASLLSADTNAATMANTLRMLAYEHDESNERVNVALREEMKKGGARIQTSNSGPASY